MVERNYRKKTYIFVFIIIALFLLLLSPIAAATYNRPWDTPQKAIDGGAQYIGQDYINKGQYTSYFKRFNVSNDRYYSAYTHQYMTNIRAPYSEAYKSYTAYKGQLNQNFHFYIPVYTSMVSQTSLPANNKTTITKCYTTTQKQDATFEKSIDGFPEDYKPYLRYLHTKYPHWTFHVINTGLNWITATTKEQKSAYIDGSDTTLRAKDSKGNYILKEGKSWYLANIQTTAFFMDPRNFLNEQRIFMFESLKYENNVDVDEVQKALDGTCLSGSKDGKKYAQMFIDAGKKANVNPVYLASLAAQEQGSKGNVAITGEMIYYEGKLYKNIYNYFNIGAKSSAASPARAGVAYAANYTSNTTEKMNSSNITISVNNATYNGSALKPAVTVKFKTNTISSDQYTLTYSNNINAGTGTVKVTGKSPFTSYDTATFKINPLSIDKLTYTTIEKQAYTGSPLKPKVTIKNGTTTLKEGTDYTLSYSSNTNVGTGTVTVQGKGNYTGVKTLSFTIYKDTSKTSLNNATVTNINSTYSYTGKAVEVVPIVKIGSKTLKKDTDYTLSYKNNVNEGTASLIITGKGNYIGTINKTYKIVKKSIKNATISYNASQTYTGSQIKPSVTVKYDGKTLKLNTDYTVSYGTNKSVGKGTITIKGKGAYTGSITKTFTINKKVNFTVSSVSNKTYTGRAIKPNVVVKSGNKTLKKNIDYTVTYGKNTNVGKATMTIKGKGKYTGTVTKTFIILPKQVSWVSLKGYNTTLNLSYKKVPGASGYRVEYSTKKTSGFKNLTTSSLTPVIKNLPRKTKYYVQVRAYVKVDGKTYYGNPSWLLEVKTK